MEWADCRARRGVAADVAALGGLQELSRALAASREHDLHGLLGLLQQGCPPATALRITALDERAVSA